ncbi:MAG: Dessication-associated protein [Sphingomonas bacterium]|uniref:ferritin-like domain-containing protein n=1 Tax=Sphingomonas bacterium TaxID=1895847 RepID=UPI002607337E|nr:ferritin-like domain-containing protein [Sphingomonas bacterium]MDB5707070.1 Dessication-associated protein [Sphingomonas bacterium]
MTDDQQLIEGTESRLDPDSALRNERREFFKAALGAAAVTAAGAGALSIATSASAATIADNDMGNFLLQLEYLAAQYYSFAVTGAGLAAAQLTGVGTAGAATGARQVTFTDPLVAQYAKEIAQDLAGHVSFLRTTLGTDGATAQPAIDLGTTATGAFSRLAAAATIVATGASFDPYASDENFLLGAFMFEDVIVTAYTGATSTISDKTLLGSLLGILSSHAHHTAVIRSLLYAKGVATPALRTYADKISDVRDALDNSTVEDDQGISSTTVSGNILSNVVPAGPDGLAYGRTSGAVLNVLYLNSAAVSSGGFFTAGLNGTVKVSTAN